MPQTYLYRQLGIVKYSVFLYAPPGLPPCGCLFFHLDFPHLTPSAVDLLCGIYLVGADTDVIRLFLFQLLNRIFCLFRQPALFLLKLFVVSVLELVAFCFFHFIPRKGKFSSFFVSDFL